MAIKNIYFDTWEEYESFVKKQLEIIAKKKPKSLANYPSEQEEYDRDQDRNQRIIAAQLATK